MVENMNEEEIRKVVRQVLFDMIIEPQVFKDLKESIVTGAIDYVENNCVCKNYRQKHRTELLKKLTGENKTFKYTGA